MDRHRLIDGGPDSFERQRLRDLRRGKAAAQDQRGEDKYQDERDAPDSSIFARYGRDHLYPLGMRW
jgi:hypothetical protein